MSKKRKQKLEYRYYEMPMGSPVLALLGEKWTQNYGRNIDYLHFHNYLEIGYCYAGKGSLIVEEEDKTFEGGMFTIIPRNIPHTTNSEGESFSSWEYLFIDTDTFLTECYRENQNLAERLIRRINQEAYLFSEDERPEMAATIRWVIEIMRGRKEFYLEEARGVVLSLLMQIARENKSGSNQFEKKIGNTGIIAPALDYISEHSEQQLKIEALAQLCHISETHFRRVFHECMDMTPVEYLNWVRIKTACNELKRTKDSIGAIAARTGFGTLSTFNRNFQKIMGISPRQWRKDAGSHEQKMLKYDIKTEEGW